MYAIIHIYEVKRTLSAQARHKNVSDNLKDLSQKKYVHEFLSSSAPQDVGTYWRNPDAEGTGLSELSKFKLVTREKEDSTRVDGIG